MQRVVSTAVVVILAGILGGCSAGQSSAPSFSGPKTYAAAAPPAPGTPPSHRRRHGLSPTNASTPSARAAFAVVAVDPTLRRLLSGRSVRMSQAYPVPDSHTEMLVIKTPDIQGIAWLPQQSYNEAGTLLRSYWLHMRLLDATQFHVWVDLKSQRIVWFFPDGARGQSWQYIHPADWRLDQRTTPPA